MAHPRIVDVTRQDHDGRLETTRIDLHAWWLAVQQEHWKACGEEEPFPDALLHESKVDKSQSALEELRRDEEVVRIKVIRYFGQ
jgi:hypothetical protein